MWVIFEEIEKNVSLTSMKGAKYTANIVRGMKKGYQEEEDTPYEKKVFDNTFTTVKDRRGEVQMDIVEFFDACEEGDLIVIENEKPKGSQHWQIISLENKNRSVVTDDLLPAAPVVAPVGGGDPLGAAVGFVNVLVNNGHYKEGTSPEVLLDAVESYKHRLDALFSQALDAE